MYDNVLFTTDNVTSEIIDKITNCCKMSGVDFDSDNFGLCYLISDSSFILLTNDFLYHFYDSKYPTYIKIPNKRILNIFTHHRWSLGDFIALDVSTKESEFIITFSFTNSNEEYIRLKNEINKLIIYSQKSSDDICIINTRNNNILEEESTQNFYSYCDKKTIKLVILDNPDWFKLSYDEKVSLKLENCVKKSMLQEKTKTTQVQEHQEEIDYDNMTIEELTKLKQNLEKKKLIEDIKTMQSSASNTQSDEKVSLKDYFLSSSAESLTTKQQINENKINKIACCPKCGSTSLSTIGKKLSASRGGTGAILGSLVAPGIGTAVGAVAGGLSSKKVYCVCMNCGHKWKP